MARNRSALPSSNVSAGASTGRPRRVGRQTAGYSRWASGWRMVAVLSPAHHDALTVIARLGFAARGVIYWLVAAFALGAALRSDQRPHGFTGAMQAVLDKPLGA